MKREENELMRKKEKDELKKLLKWTSILKDFHTLNLQEVSKGGVWLILDIGGYKIGYIAISSDIDYRNSILWMFVDLGKLCGDVFEGLFVLKDKTVFLEYDFRKNEGKTCCFGKSAQPDILQEGGVK